MLCSNPFGSFSDVSKNIYEQKSIYTFFSNDHVDPESIWEAHVNSTLERLSSSQRVIVAHDTTNWGLPSSSAPDLGYIDYGQGKGLMVHVGLAMNADFVPCGTIFHQVWARPFEEMGKSRKAHLRPFEQKESYRFEAGLLGCQELLCDQEVIHLIDREADIWEVLSASRPSNHKFVIRRSYNRLTIEGTKVNEQLFSKEAQGRRKLKVTRKGENQLKWVWFEFGYTTVTLKPPSKRKGAKPVRINCVFTREINPPAGKKPIEWALYTTMEVRNTDQAEEVLHLYSQRWKVEQFFFALKSGCGIEKLQLRSTDRLLRALAIYSVVAWRVMWLTLLSREEPEMTAAKILIEAEWKALYFRAYQSFDLPDIAPSIGQAVHWIARMGGYKNRKSDGPPGMKSIWKGLANLEQAAINWINIQRALSTLNTSGE